MDFPLDHRPLTRGALLRWRAHSPNGQGAAWMLLAGTGFTFNGLLVKTLAQGGMDPFQISLARVFFALRFKVVRSGPGRVSQYSAKLRPATCST